MHLSLGGSMKRKQKQFLPSKVSKHGLEAQHSLSKFIMLKGVRFLKLEQGSQSSTLEFLDWGRDSFWRAP